MGEGKCVLYVPTACQRRQKRRSLCYLADCDLLSIVLTKNNKITSLPHSSSQGKNQSTPCFTMKRLWWQMHLSPPLPDSHIPWINVTVKKHVGHTDPLHVFQKKRRGKKTTKTTTSTLCFLQLALSTTAISCKRKVWTRCRLHEEDGRRKDWG